MKKVIISGATSQISRHLINECLANGYEVFGLYRDDKKAECLKDIQNLHLIKIELNEISTLEQILDQKDFYAFFHIAWESAQLDMRSDYNAQMLNVIYSSNALMVAKKLGCEYFIQPSSVLELTIENYIQKNDFTQSSLYDIYPNIKKFNEINCKILAKSHNIKYHSLMTTLPYGEHQKNGFIKNIIKKMLKNEDIKLVPREYPLDLIYVGDFARAFLYVLEGHIELKHPIYRLKTFEYYMENIKNILNSTSNLLYGDYKGEYFNYRYDDSLSRNNDFICKTDLKTGILKTTKWIKENEM